jgi:hypothetical protein
VLLDDPDREGQLVFVEGQLMALLVRLDGDAPSDEMVGAWFLEAGFGPCHRPDSAVFSSLEEAGSWAETTAQRHARRRLRTVE